MLLKLFLIFVATIATIFAAEVELKNGGRVSGKEFIYMNRDIKLFIGK